MFHEDIKHDTTNTLAYRYTYRSVAGAIRVKAGRNSIEPHLKEALQDRNKSLRDLFSFKTIVMKEKPKSSGKGLVLGQWIPLIYEGDPTPLPALPFEVSFLPK